MSTQTTISSYLEEHLDEHVENIRRWVAQPSESTTGTGVPQYAQLLCDSYKEFGCKAAEVVDVGDGLPGVWAFYDAGADFTIGCYSYFDTYGVDEAEWDYPPYGATITSLPGFPKVIVGRGASVKGPARAWLNALEAIIATNGELPVNVLFMSEGAEMVGSPNFASIAKATGDYLGQVDAFLSPRSAEGVGSPQVTVNLGFKGMVTFDLRCTAEAWGRGPQGGTTYSNGKSVVDSPVHRLVQALATLLGDDGNSIAIGGLEFLNAERRQTTPAEEKLIADLVARYGSGSWSGVLPVTGGVEHWAGDLAGEELLREYLYGPSINIADVRTSASWEPVALTMLIPHEAIASVELRLVTDVPASDVVEKVRRHLASHGFGDIELVPFGVWDGFLQDPDDPIVQATVETLEAYGREPVVWPIQPFGGPWAGTPHQLGVPAITGCALGGGGNGGGSANEYFVVESDTNVAGLVEAERFYADLLLRYAELARPAGR